MGLLITQASWAQQPADPKPATSAAQARLDTAALPDSLAQRLERAYFTLGRINGTIRRTADTRDLSDDLPPVEDNLETIQQNLDLYGNVVEVKQLQMYRVLLSDMQEQLGGWRTTLEATNQQITAMRRQLGQLALELPPAATLPPATTAVGRALARLHTKQTGATQLLAQRLQATAGLQTRVSESYIQDLELQDEVREQMGRFQRRNSQAELPPLWHPGSIRADDEAAALVRKSYAAQRKLVSYYFGEHWDYWVWMAVLALGFFGWVFRNFRRLRQLEAALPPTETTALPELRLHYLRPLPLAASLLVVFSLAPFFDLSPPAAYTDLLQLLLLVTLTALGWRSWPRQLFWFWLGIVGCFFALTIAYASRAPGLGMRWAMPLLNVGAGVLGWAFWRWLRQHRLLAGFVRPVVLLFVALQGLAVLAGVNGRVSLAKMFSTTAVVGLTQAISLSAFVRVLIEAFYLQAQGLRLAGGFGARFSFDRVEDGLRKALTVVVGALWLMLVSSNLNLYNLLVRVGTQALTAPHRLGSTSFTLGSVGLFFGIVFLTVQLQKYVGYVFGETDDEFNPDEDRKGSWLVAIRLVMLAVGLFLATLASGLPVDKIAIVLGALGVGIGLGLQNIINNLVSGIILIFERPFQVGDFIEVNGKTGRVKDIGIRASKLISQAGSEIIMPNGDLLSGQVINWTLSNNHIRTELALSLGPETDLGQARQLITAEILTHTNTLHKVAPEILLNSVNTAGYELRVLFWINNIRQEQALKSELLASVYQKLTQAGVVVR
ncbi:MAG: mechanosensitive ion channel domain-containing protein [Janthinobacterium lividum]